MVYLTNVTGRNPDTDRIKIGKKFSVSKKGLYAAGAVTASAGLVAGAVAILRNSDDGTAGAQSPIEAVGPESDHHLYVANTTGIISEANQGALFLQTGSPENIQLNFTQRDLVNWSEWDSLVKNWTELDTNNDRLVNAIEMKAVNLSDGLYVAKVSLKYENGTLLNQTLQEKHLANMTDRELGFILDTSAPDIKIVNPSGSPPGKYRRADGTPILYTNMTDAEWDITLSDELAGILYSEITHQMNGATINHLRNNHSANASRNIGEVNETTGKPWIERGSENVSMKAQLVMGVDGEYKLLVKAQDFGDTVAEVSVDLIKDGLKPTALFKTYDDIKSGWHSDDRLNITLDGTGSPIEEAYLFINGEKALDLMEKKTLFGRTARGLPVDNYSEKFGISAIADDNANAWDVHFDNDDDYKVKVVYKDAAGNWNETEVNHWVDRVAPALTNVKIENGTLTADVYDVSGIGEYYFKVRRDDSVLVGTGPDPIKITDGRTTDRLRIENISQYGIKAGDVLELNAGDAQGKWRTYMIHLNPGHMGNMTYEPPTTAFDTQPPGQGDDYDNGNYQQNQPQTKDDYCEPNNPFEPGTCS